ncbi:tail fiber assembly protein [Pseudomonas sp. ZT5P21]
MNRNFYQDPENGEVFEYSDEDVANGFVRDGLVALTDEEVEAHLAPPVLSLEQLAVVALNERDRRLDVAALRIAPLQDAVDLGEASENEEQSLLAWKRYRVAVNRISQQAGFPTNIDWPAPPG